MAQYIYSKRYWVDSMHVKGSSMKMDYYRKRESTIEENEFVDMAVALSEKERISLDILEFEDVICADFRSKGVIFSFESTKLLEELISACDMVEMIIPYSENPTVILRLKRNKR